MKIGTISFHSSNNFGCVLQSFALSQAVRALIADADVEEIYYRRTKLVYSDNTDALTQKRIDGFKEFRDNCMNMTEVIYDTDEIAPDRYDVLISGSDQVFGYSLVYGYEKAFFLEFATPEVKKAAYAASMGAEVFEIDEQKEWLQRHVGNFDHISVREKTFKKNIEEMIKKEVPVCLDPTLLLSAGQWSEYERRPASLGDEKYVLLYALGYEYCRSEEEKATRMAVEVAQANGYKLIHYYKDPPAGLPDDAMSFYYEGPREFLWLVHHAEYVICCSFHATAFSVIYHKPFYTFHVPDNGVRMKDLVETAGFPERYVYDVVSQKECDWDIDWVDCERRLDVQRDISRDFLRKALG